LYNRIL